jgi:hypothetical protein
VILDFPTLQCSNFRGFKSHFSTNQVDMICRQNTRYGWHECLRNSRKEKTLTKNHYRVNVQCRFSTLTNHFRTIYFIIIFWHNHPAFRRKGQGVWSWVKHSDRVLLVRDWTLVFSIQISNHIPTQFRQHDMSTKYKIRMTWMSVQFKKGENINQKTQPRQGTTSVIRVTLGNSNHISTQISQHDISTKY